MAKHLIDVLQPLWSSASSLVPRGVQRRMFGNAMKDRLENLRRLGFAPRQVLDIGAYEGHWTQDARGIFPHAKFLMVEAQDAKAPLLQSIVDGSTGMVALELGLLGSEEADKTFYEMETGSSMYQEISSVPRSTVTKRSKTIDAVLRKHGMEDIDLAKLDVQGAELDILRGGPRLLERCQLFILEASVRPYNDKAPLIGDVIAFMAQAGYRVFDLCEVKRVAANDLVLQVDLLFAREGEQNRALLGS